MHYPSVMSEALTLQCALDGVSLGRFGDGELKLAHGRDAKSQHADPQLAKILREILTRPRPGFLACIPNIAGSVRSPKEAFWAQYRSARYAGLYRASTVYGSSFITRPDSSPMAMGAAYFDRLADLWRGREVVLVGGSGKSLAPGDLPEAAAVEQVVTPRQHAFSAYPDLLAMLKGERRRVFLCCGATATALAWSLAAVGVHAVDLGHVAMFLRKHRAGDPLEVTEDDRAAP